MVISRCVNVARLITDATDRQVEDVKIARKGEGRRRRRPGVRYEDWYTV